MLLLHYLHLLLHHLELLFHHCQSCCSTYSRVVAPTTWSCYSFTSTLIVQPPTISSCRLKKFWSKQIAVAKTFMSQTRGTSIVEAARTTSFLRRWSVAPRHPWWSLRLFHHLKTLLHRLEYILHCFKCLRFTTAEVAPPSPRKVAVSPLRSRFSSPLDYCCSTYGRLLVHRLKLSTPELIEISTEHV